MDEQQLKQIQQAVEVVLDRRLQVDEKTHSADHAYVRLLIERDRRRRKLWDGVRAHVLGWGAVALILWLVTMLGESVLSALRNALKAKGGP